MSLRSEPFRLLFPLGLILGLVGVAPWLLCGLGLMAGYPVIFHSLTMTQAFVGAVAAGFLGTMIPRRLGAVPMSMAELAVLALSLSAIPLALATQSVALGEALNLVALSTLGAFVVRRLTKQARSSAPPSFALLPLGLVAGAAGSALLMAATLGWVGGHALSVGRSLAQEGLLLLLVLAIVPMLDPILAGGDPPKPSRRAALGYGLAGAIVVATLAAEPIAPRLCLLIRGLVCAAIMAAATRGLSPLRRSGFHRRLFRVALALIPAGELAASAWPDHRVAMLHLTFIGGYSLLVFAVASHVVMLHTDREWLAERAPFPVILAGAATIGAALVRAGADRAGAGYLSLLGVAAALWLIGAVAWGVFVLTLLATPSEPEVPG